MKKNPSWRYCWQMLKKLTKVVINPLLSQLLGGKRMEKYCGISIWCFFCAKIKPKLKRIQKTIRKQGFLMIFFSILMVFRSLLNFGSILAQKLNRFICKTFFCHPGHPWSCESSGEGRIKGPIWHFATDSISRQNLYHKVEGSNMSHLVTWARLLRMV